MISLWIIFLGGLAPSSDSVDLFKLAFDLSNDESDSMDSFCIVSSRPVSAANSSSGTNRRLLEVSASFTSYVLLFVHSTTFSSGSPKIYINVIRSNYPISKDRNYLRQVELDLIMILV